MHKRPPAALRFLCILWPTASLAFVLICTAGIAQTSAMNLEVVRRELAPGGTLRAAINFGNSVLAQKDAAGNPTGITPDLARELGRRLGVPVELVPFEFFERQLLVAPEFEFGEAFFQPPCFAPVEP